MRSNQDDSSSTLKSDQELQSVSGVMSNTMQMLKVKSFKKLIKERKTIYNKMPLVDRSWIEQ
ncbi:hypothetical protein ACS127_10515 [Amphibacillus sp. Q70]|uniref:hypothetical protein n=1 Tax=Amphibacillus sp. Q70 TaxID=3453416 RepID=UPI003F870A9F